MSFLVAPAACLLSLEKELNWILPLEPLRRPTSATPVEVRRKEVRGYRWEVSALERKGRWGRSRHRDDGWRRGRDGKEREGRTAWEEVESAMMFVVAGLLFPG
jgi:hypothetical protein